MWFDLSYGKTKSGKLWHSLDTENQAVCSKKRKISKIEKVNIKPRQVCLNCDEKTKSLWDVPSCTNIFAETIDLTDKLTRFPKVIGPIISGYYNSWTWDEEKDMFVDDHNHPCQCGGCFQKYNNNELKKCRLAKCGKHRRPDYFQKPENYEKTINRHCLYCWCDECVCELRRERKLFKKYHKSTGDEDFDYCFCQICEFN